MFTAWKLIPTVVLMGALIAGWTVRPPSEPVSPVELRRLVIAVLALYGAGAATLIAHRMLLADIVFGSGLLLCSLALWLSRGLRRPPQDGTDDGGGGGEPPVEPPPSGPEFDWAFYEDQFSEPVA